MLRFIIFYLLFLRKLSLEESLRELDYLFIISLQDLYSFIVLYANYSGHISLNAFVYFHIVMH